MTRAFLKMARAQAAITAYRDALDVLRRHPSKDAERLLLARIAAKKPILDDWQRTKQQERNDAADAEYREANVALIEGDGC